MSRPPKVYVNYQSAQFEVHLAIDRTSGGGTSQYTIQIKFDLFDLCSDVPVCTVVAAGCHSGPPQEQIEQENCAGYGVGGGQRKVY